MPFQSSAPLSLLALLGQSLSRFSSCVAVEDRTRRLTHSELHASANDFARTLTALHLPKKSIVGLYMDGSVEYIIALLGTLKADMIFMPLNTVFPRQRLLAMLEKTAPALLVTDHRLADELRMKTAAEGQDFATPALLVFPPHSETTGLIVSEGFREQTGQGTSRSSLAETHVQSGLDDAGYILTTSGSTGESKAILGSLAGLAHFIQWETKEFGFNASTRGSLLSPVTFDVSLRDIFAPLSVGGCVCIPDGATMQNPLMLLQWLQENNITVMHIVPTLFRMLIHTMRTEGRGEAALPCLEHVLLAGEVVHGSDIKQWRQVAGKKSTLVNLYGPSETTLAKLFHRVDDDKVATEETVPIGRPLPDTEVFIVENGQACAPGEPGEIFIKTPYMSKGYYNDRQLTEKHFIPNPLSVDEAELIYKTGDQGVFLQDGSVRFLGRLDGQIKLHGRRIELEEIETTLRQHQDVQQAAAALKVDSNGIPRLIGYLVTAGGRRLTVETLRSFLEDKLPAYMLPQAYVHLGTLPLTHSRKIDRNALPEPGRERPDMECPYVPPGNEQEKVLCDIWGRILEVDRVGTQDGFFELGGTSVLAMRMIEVIRKALQVDLPVVKLFQYPNVALLAEYLQGLHACGVSFADPEQRGRQRRAIISSRRHGAGR